MADPVTTYPNIQMVVDTLTINRKLHGLAARLNDDFKDKSVICLVTVPDALVFVGQLLPILTFDLQVECLTVTYNTKKPKIDWSSLPLKLKDKLVIVFTGVCLDNGIGDLLVDRLLSVDKAQHVYHCTFLDKTIESSNVNSIDYSCLRLPNTVHYFGFGLAYHSETAPAANNLSRNSPDLWSVTPQ